MIDVKPIDPAEVVTATLGVRRVIDRSTDKIRKSELDEMQTLAKRIASLSKALVKGELTEAPREKVNYRTMLRRLLEDNFTLEDKAAMMATFPTDASDEAMIYADRVEQMIKLLQEKYPVATFTTLAGTQTLLPSDMALWRWAGLLQIADDPLCVFDLMSTGSLTKAQAAAMKLVYPSLSSAIDMAIQQAIPEEKAKRKSFEVPPRATVGIHTWQGTTTYSPTLIGTMQNNLKAENTKKQNPSAPAGPANAKGRADLTSAQKAAYGEQR